MYYKTISLWMYKCLHTYIYIYICVCVCLWMKKNVSIPVQVSLVATCYFFLSSWISACGVVLIMQNQYVDWLVISISSELIYVAIYVNYLYGTASCNCFIYRINEWYHIKLYLLMSWSVMMISILSTKSIFCKFTSMVDKIKYGFIFTCLTW